MILKMKAKRAEVHEEAKAHIKKAGALQTASTALKGVAAGAVIGGVAVNEIGKKRVEQAATKTKMQQLSSNYAR